MSHGAYDWGVSKAGVSNLRRVGWIQHTRWFNPAHEAWWILVAFWQRADCAGFVSGQDDYVSSLLRRSVCGRVKSSGPTRTELHYFGLFPWECCWPLVKGIYSAIWPFCVVFSSPEACVLNVVLQKSTRHYRSAFISAWRKLFFVNFLRLLLTREMIIIGINYHIDYWSCHTHFLLRCY